MLSRVVVAHACNPITWEAEAGESLSLRPAWSTEWVPDSQGYTEKPCLGKKKAKNKKQKQKTKKQTTAVSSVRVSGCSEGMLETEQLLLCNTKS